MSDVITKKVVDVFGVLRSRRSYPLIFSLSVAIGCATAPPLLADDEAEMAALMAMLNAETSVATQNKMNADFVPGTVSVLHGDDMRKLGARNVAEGLGRVPGLYVTEGNRGEYRVQVRGVGTTLFGSNIKILLDGMPMNSAVSGAADAVLRIPIEQIERIEVVRGPGSALYGEYALTGLVNIVLRNNENSVGMGAGRDAYRQADFIVSSGEKNADIVTWNANGSVWGRDDTGRISGIDNFAANRVNPQGNSPKETDDSFFGSLVRAGAGVQGYSINAVFIEKKIGDYYGRNGNSAYEPTPGVEKIVGAELAKLWQISDQFGLGFSANTLHTYDETTETLGLPAGVVPPGPPGPPLPNDVYRADSSRSRQHKVDVYVSYKLAASNTLLVGASYADLAVMDAGGEVNRLGIGRQTLGPQATLVSKGAKRHIRSVYFQDQWRASDKLEFTLGARYDAYNDWGESVSPRFAAVWRLSDVHIVKMQYAGAFRPPTLSESYPGPLSFGPGRISSGVSAEELISSELSYIYRHDGKVLRATLFETDISDLIEFYQNPGEAPRYRNHGRIESWGGELEWEQYLGRDWKFISNFSYVDAKDTVIDDELVGSVNWLGNAGLSWDVLPAVTLSGYVHYVGEQEGWGNRVRARQDDIFEDYTTFDMTLSVANVGGVRGLSMLVGGSNIFNAEYETIPNPAQYPNGLTSEGADWWAYVKYQFGEK